MNILYLAMHPPLAPERPATGMQVRVAGVKAALEQSGHRVHCLSPLPPEHQGERTGFYDSPQALARVLGEHAVDAVLVSYWELLGHLPSDTPPVIVDVIAPRLLEAMYQAEGSVQFEGRQMLALLPRGDHFLVGNQRQHDALLTLLLLSGFDCREQSHISIVPISASAPPPAEERPAHEICLISAGVDWPWRQSHEYLEVIAAFAATHPGISLRQLTGGYPGAGTPAQTQAEGLVGYSAMRRILASCQIGLELGRRNTERELSDSFRLIEYLQSGLPVMVNSWLPSAERIQRANAGWLVDSPEQLRELLAELHADPRVLVEKARGARALVTGELTYRHTLQPLLDYLAAPRRPARAWSGFFQAPATLTDQTWPAGGARRWKPFVKDLYQLLLCRHRPKYTPHLLMVTRPDLFPADHGAAVKIIRTAEALSRTGRDVWLITDSRREYLRFQAGAMTTHAFPRWLRWLALPRPIGLLRLMLRGFPVSNSFLYFPLTDASYLLRTLYLATRQPIGAYIAEFPAYVRPCRVARALLGGRVLLVEHNVEYERIKAQVPDLGAHGYQQLKQVEIAMCQLADAVVTVSEQDRETLSRDGADPRKLHCIPHGVDLAAFASATRRDPRHDYGLPASHHLLVYHGPYSYPPNLEAMLVMAEQILPRLRQRGIAVSVLAIGANPPTESPHPDLHFTGSLEHLEEVLPAADLALVPLLRGGGTRMKILDYFAAGVPVISTHKGIEGIPVQHGEQALIHDDYDALCDAVAAVLGDPALRQRLVTNARALVASLSWDAVVARYLPLLFGTAPGLQDLSPSAPTTDAKSA
ncbi:MAG: glycosyltransferase [Sphingobacteriia bacterium]|nr:glycosyltransferase [Sphingobacteriia bacterium]NCC39594.1 glycosyltransferase [Gammaproteobacteria bacterium]